MLQTLPRLPEEVRDGLGFRERASAGLFGLRRRLRWKRKEPELTEFQRVLMAVADQEKRRSRELSEDGLIALFLHLNDVDMPGVADRIDVNDFLNAVHRQRGDVNVAQGAGVAPEEFARRREEWERMNVAAVGPDTEVSELEDLHTRLRDAEAILDRVAKADPQLYYQAAVRTDEGRAQHLERSHKEFDVAKGTAAAARDPTGNAIELALAALDDDKDGQELILGRYGVMKKAADSDEEQEREDTVELIGSLIGLVTACGKEFAGDEDELREWLEGFDTHVLDEGESNP
jgi:hypothetical protein